MADTLARLSGVVAARGLKVFAVIDHSDEARRVGLALRDTRLFIVGSPKVTTPVIEAAPLAALDLPLRVVVREDGYQTEDQLPRHRPRLLAGTGSTPIWPGHWRASTRGPAPW